MLPELLEARFCRCWNKNRNVNGRKYIWPGGDMKRIIWILLLIPSLCFAEKEIEIKGIKVGMDKEDVEKIVVPLSLFDENGKPQKIKPSNFTVAGIRGKGTYSSTLVKYDNDKLTSFSFYFSPNDFSMILQAIKDKYPRLKCKNEMLSNAFGASFKNVKCSIKNNVSVLELDKYIDLETSALSLYSHEYIKNLVEKQKERSKDL